jgi:hypothetical protein
MERGPGLLAALDWEIQGEQEGNRIPILHYDFLFLIFVLWWIRVWSVAIALLYATIKTMD